MLRGGETYRLSLHLRGEKAGATAVVRLLGDKGEVTFLKTLEALGTEWKKYEMSFQCKASAMSAVLQIGVQGEQTVLVDMASMFSKSALACGGFRPDLLEMIADEQPANIRYPGGCFASQYRWKDGIGPSEKRTYHGHIIWADRDSNQMGTDEFIDLCRRVKAEPIIVVNLSRGVDEALDWLEYCNGSVETKWGKVRADNGHSEPYNVKYWEVDNETWGMGAKPYAEFVKKFSAALRAKDPTIKIIACGGCAYDNDKTRTLGWNQTLIDEAATDFDYLSIHYYNGISVPADFVGDPTRYETYIRDEIGPMIAKSKNPKMLVYCSEWGMMNAGWSSGLYTGGILNGFERLNGLLTMSCPAVWLQRVSPERPNPRWGSCSIIFDHETSYGAPMHVVLKLWRESYQPKRLAVQGPKKPLNVTAAMSQDGKTVTFKAVNTGRGAVDVNVVLGGSRKIGNAAMQVIAPGSEGTRNTLDEPEAIKPAAARMTVKGKTLQFTMPALSVGVVTVKLQ
jgi:alpha-N-arabinofuranosidase